MKNYIERTNALLKRRDEYILKKNKRTKTLIKITSVACSFLIICALGIGIWQAGPFDSKDLDEGVAAPEIFPQQQEGENETDQTPEQNTDNADNTLQSTVPSDNKEPQQSTQVQDPGQSTDNNTESKEPDVSLEAITPSLKGDKPLNSDDNVVTTTVYEPLKFEIDDDFSPYEVVVTLTEEESQIDQVYTTDYFPQVDIYHIGLYDEYYFNNFYRLEMYPGFKNLRTIILQLNSPSKETVLEYCELLEKDKRVLYARPNVNTELNNILKVYPSKELRSYPWDISKEDFSEFDDIQDISRKMGDPYIYIYFKFPYQSQEIDQEYMREQFKNAINCENIDYVELVHVQYNEAYISCYITEERLSSDKEITVDDFAGLNLKRVAFISGTQATGSYYMLMFMDFDKRNIVEAKKILSQNPIVKKIWIHNSTILPRFDSWIPDNPEPVITPDTPY